MIRRQHIVLLVVSCSIFFEALDIAIVNLAMPLIQRDFGLAGDMVQWMQTLYVLFYGGFLILGGKLADTVGRKKIFMAGSVLFLLTSLGAGFASSFVLLTVFRALQGLGAALVMPAAFSIITNTFTEPVARHKAIGVFGSFAAIGSGSGLSIGGLLATYLGWPWMFFINVPVIAVVLLLGYLYITPDDRTDTKPTPDLWSGMLLTLGIVMLTYVIHELKHVQEQAVVLAILFGGVLLCLRMFALRSKGSKALIDVSLLNNRGTVTGVSAVLMMGAFFTGFLFLISIVLQTNLSYTAAQAGLMLMPFTIVSAIVSKALLPRALKRISMTQAGIMGMIFMACGGTLLFCALVLDNNLVLILCAVACVNGFGIAICFLSLTVLATQEVPHEHHGLAGSVVNTCFFFGGGIGLSMLGLVMPHDAQESATLLPAIILMVFAVVGVVWLVMRSRPGRVAFSH